MSGKEKNKCEPVNLLDIGIQIKWCIIPFVLFTLNSCAQHDYKVATIAFYNVENLFDTISSVDKINCEEKPCTHISIPFLDDYPLRKGKFDYQYIKDSAFRKTHDQDFTVSGRLNWNSKKFHQKVEHISEVLYDVGQSVSKNAPVVIGLAEIENRKVLETLIKTYPLSRKQYGIVHYNSLDDRGIDVALLYNKNAFSVVSNKKITVKLYNNKGKRDYTRDILLVSGLLDGELFHFLVAHWPSRRGGRKRSNPLRMQAAKLSRSIIDSITDQHPNANIVLMGDLNDDPTDASVLESLSTAWDKKKVNADKLYNTMYDFHKRGFGTLAWADSWNLFDQIIISSPLLKANHYSWAFYKSGIYNKKYLQQKQGRYKGYPFRTFASATYLGGYSDHFPVYIYLIKQQ